MTGGKTAPQRVIHVGVGVFGRRWCSEFLKNNVADGTIEVVGLVDRNPDSLEVGRKLLGLKPEQCFTDAGAAFGSVPADFCTIAVTPAHHEAVIDAALAHGLDILCEKPIADTMEASIRIEEKVKAASRRMAVTMSHRFDQDKTTLRRVVRSGVIGDINHIGMRFLSDMRHDLGWSAPFRHTMEDPLLIEGSIHHLDIIADLAGAPCEEVSAMTWKPRWAEYKGDTDAVVTLSFANGVHAVYEGSVTHPVGLNSFYNEYIRVDGELGTVVLTHRGVEVFRRQDIWKQQTEEGNGQKVPLLTQQKWINTWLIERFAQWRVGGAPLETDVSANLQTSAIIFGAIESRKTRAPVNIGRFIDGYRNGAR